MRCAYAAATSLIRSLRRTSRMSQDTDQSTVSAEAGQPGDSPVIDGIACSICGDPITRDWARWAGVAEHGDGYAHGDCWHSTTALPHIESDPIIRALRISGTLLAEALVKRLNELGRVACRSCAHVPERSRRVMSCGCLFGQEAMDEADAKASGTSSDERRQ